ncbi:hypothetical protein CRUP_001606 [Coryphaenoides rupestris]|nr:hypothetical protein CRUP_001606 [Coryphaenoides rupestris]
MVQNSQSQKSFPQGNQWAVGHLMGRKSIVDQVLPGPQLDQQQQQQQDTMDYQQHRLASSETRAAGSWSGSGSDRGLLERPGWRGHLAPYKYLRECQFQPLEGSR